MAKQQTPKQKNTLSSNMKSSGKMAMANNPLKQASPPQRTSTLTKTVSTVKTPSKATSKPVASKTTIKASTNTPAKKPIALSEVKITANRKLQSTPDSMSLGRGTAQKNYATKDIKNAINSNPNLVKGVDTSSKSSMSKGLYGKDNENMVADILKNKKK